MLGRIFSQLCERVHPDPQPNVLMTVEPIRVAGSWKKLSGIIDQIRSLIWLKAHGFDVRWTLPFATFSGSLTEHVIVVGENANIPANHHLKHYDRQALIDAARVCAESDFV